MKKIYLILALLLLSGCSINYNLSISDDGIFKETITGTVADKDSLAELASQEEFIVSAAYNRAYKIMKSKVENAQELLASVKKVLSRRIQEAELTRMGGK